MWWWLSLAKPLFLSVGLITALISGHVAFKSWLGSKVDRAVAEERISNALEQSKQVLEESQANSAEEVKRLKARLVTQEVILTKMRDEVEWARTHVAKQKKAIEELRDGSDTELSECLDVRIDTDLLR